jgi:hypothetical protein
VEVEIEKKRKLPPRARLESKRKRQTNLKRFMGNSVGGTGGGASFIVISSKPNDDNEDDDDDDDGDDRCEFCYQKQSWKFLKHKMSFEFLYFRVCFVFSFSSQTSKNLLI